MKLDTFTIGDPPENGRLLSGFLKLRYNWFVARLNWSLPNDGMIEMDQYDNPLASYSVVSLNGEVIAGARAVPANADWMGWSYMINDARLGRLTGLPGHGMPDTGRSKSLWECTRLVVDDTLSQEDREMALALVIDGLCQMARKRGVTELVSLSPILFGRVLRRLGYAPSSCGESFHCEDDGRVYRAFKMAVPPVRLNGLTAEAS